MLLNNEIKLVKLLESYFYFRGGLNCIFMSMYFGDVYILSMQTITLLRDVCFIRITSVWCRNIIMRFYMTYLL